MADYEEGYVIIERRTGNFGTFVWGLLVGAAVALLWAPKSGRETRQELTESATRIRDQAEGKVREVQHTVTETVDDVRRQFEEGVESARRAVESGKEAARASRAQMESHLRDSSAAFRSGFEAARSPGRSPDNDLGEGPAGEAGKSDDIPGT
jgi:gas vesicle protein